MTISSSAIIEIAAAVYGLKPKDILGSRVFATHVKARFIAVFLFREFRPELPKVRIAKALRKDASTVRNALEKFEAFRLADLGFLRRSDLALDIARQWEGAISEKFGQVLLDLNGPVKDRVKVVSRSVSRDQIWREDAAERAALVRCEAKFFAAVRHAYPDLEIGV